ncbi:MAG TPA: cation transporter, partial [Methyloceanibacter sp.]|nr:cation transporter [Methyloceanibacter sp.]
MGDRLRFRVEGMDCASCARKIETALARVLGVSEVAVNTSTETLRLQAAGEDTAEQVGKVVRDLGYRIIPLDPKPKPQSPGTAAGDTRAPGGGACPCCDGPATVPAMQPTGKPERKGKSADRPSDHGPDHGGGLHDHAHAAPLGRSWWRTAKGRLTIACGLAFVAAYVIGRIVSATEHWAFLLAMAVGLVPIARRALVAARFGTPFSIEMLMTIAAVGAVIIGATEEAATVVFLFLVGELLEGVAAGRAR